VLLRALGNLRGTRPRAGMNVRHQLVERRSGVEAERTNQFPRRDVRVSRDGGLLPRSWFPIVRQWICQANSFCAAQSGSKAGSKSVRKANLCKSDCAKKMTSSLHRARKNTPLKMAGLLRETAGLGGTPGSGKRPPAFWRARRRRKG
jgi:hypothetical protein